MTRVRIPAPDIEADVSAEQVVAYLLREGWKPNGSNVEHTWRYFRKGRKRVEVPVLPSMRRRASLLASIIEDIGFAVKRHPSDVLADIVGPAVGVVGARCEPIPRSRVRLPCARLACGFCGKPRGEAKVFIAGMSGEMICDGCIALAGDILDGTAELKDSPAHGAGESEEP